ncbi:MAG: carboxypeptidase Q [bacterium]
MPVAIAATPEDVPALLDAAAADDDQAWQRLTHLCDDIGHRITGSDALTQAIQWSVSELKQDGFDSVIAEPVQAKAWVRGHERVSVLPDSRPLNVLALGNSAGTPDGPVDVEVVVVTSFDELTELGDSVAGKAVLFNVPFTTYGETVGYRVAGPRLAAEQGAAVALVRSISPVSLNTPHTGMTDFAETAPIPAIALTLEDAEWMHRRQRDGHPARIRVDLGAHSIGTVDTANVVAEKRGTEFPDEVVVVGCHLDSWDVGQGAQDDGAGCVLAWEAARDVVSLGPSKRTLRLVLYTNEESGLAGGAAYPGAHPNDRHVAAVESDTGAGAATGFRVHAVNPTTGDADSERAYRFITRLNEQQFTARENYAGADISPLVKAGTIGFGVDHDTTNYWPIHHTKADTLEKIDRQDLQDNVRLTAGLLMWLLNADDAHLE